MDLRERSAQIQAELTALNSRLRETLPFNEYEPLMKQKTALAREFSAIQPQLMRAKTERRKSAIDGSSETSRRLQQGHLLWCQAFVDVAKQMLPIEVFSSIRQRAGIALGQQDAIKVEMSVTENEKLVLSLFTFMGIQRKWEELWQQALERTDLTENDVREALQSLVARGIVSTKNEYYSRNK